MSLPSALLKATVYLDGERPETGFIGWYRILPSNPPSDDLLVPESDSSAYENGDIEFHLDKPVGPYAWPTQGLFYDVWISIDGVDEEKNFRVWVGPNTDLIDLGDIHFVTPALVYDEDALELIEGAAQTSNNLWDLTDLDLARENLGLIVPERYELPLEIGEANLPRFGLNTSSNAQASGQVALTYFTAKKTEEIGRVRIPSGSVAAAATPSLIRVGVYEEDAVGDLTLVAATANDTTLFAGMNTEYTKSFSATFEKVEGQRYAVGILIISGAALPTFLAMHPNNSSVLGTIYCRAPRIYGFLGSQTDLPASISAGSISNGQARLAYAELLPPA